MRQVVQGAPRVGSGSAQMADVAEGPTNALLVREASHGELVVRARPEGHYPDARGGGRDVEGPGQVLHEFQLLFEVRSPDGTGPVQDEDDVRRFAAAAFRWRRHQTAWSNTVPTTNWGIVLVGIDAVVNFIIVFVVVVVVVVVVAVAAAATVTVVVAFAIAIAIAIAITIGVAIVIAVTIVVGVAAATIVVGVATATIVVTIIYCVVDDAPWTDVIGADWKDKRYCT